MEFSSKIKKLRTAKGLTQKQIADYLNVSQNAIYNWENGKREPNMDMQKRIAKVFNFPLYLLLDDNYDLGNIELEMKRARPVNSYEMAEPPKPFTAPLTPNYDDSIRIKPTPEQIEKYLNNAEAEELLKRHFSGEKLTDEECQKVSTYIEYTRESYAKLREEAENHIKIINKYLNSSAQISTENLQILKEKLQQLTDIADPRPNNYETLNEIGQQKVEDYISDLANIPEYQKKPDTPPQE